MRITVVIKHELNGYVRSPFPEVEYTQDIEEARRLPVELANILIERFGNDYSMVSAPDIRQPVKREKRHNRAVEREKTARKKTEPLTGWQALGKKSSLPGWSAALFEQKWDEQEGKCPICGRYLPIFDLGERAPHRDHSHRTGEARGLLCPGCNGLIGFCLESPTTLLRAIIYLLAYEGYPQFAPLIAGEDALNGVSIPKLIATLLPPLEEP